MKRLLALGGAVLVAAGGGAVALTTPHRPSSKVWVDSTPKLHSMSLCLSTDCGPDAAELHWSLAPWGHTTTGYYVFLGATQEADVPSSPWIIPGGDCGTTFTLGVEAHDSSSDVSPKYTANYTSPSCGAAPADTAEPVVSGTVATGDVLATTNGTWTGSPTGFSYQWQDCAIDGTSCSNIGGATSSTYTVASGDAGHTLEAVVTATNTNGSTPADAPIAPLVDAFNGTSVDTNVWGVMNQQGDTSNSEIECYEPSQVTVASNQLTEADQFISGGFTCPAGTPSSTNPLHYLSGAVYESATAFTYGTIKVDAKLAGPFGTSWPAIWMLGASCQTPTWLTAGAGSTGANCPWSSDASDAAEVDIAEGDETSGSLNQEVWNNGPVKDCTPTVSSYTSTFHVYELDWSAGSMTFKVDGTTTCTTTTSVPSHPMFLIINTAICNEPAGGACGPPSSGSLPSSTVVDYVHVSH